MHIPFRKSTQQYSLGSIPLHYVLYSLQPHSIHPLQVFFRLLYTLDTSNCIIEEMKCITDRCSTCKEIIDREGLQELHLNKAIEPEDARSSQHPARHYNVRKTLQSYFVRIAIRLFCKSRDKKEAKLAASKRHNRATADIKSACQKTTP